MPRQEHCVQSRLSHFACKIPSIGDGVLFAALCRTQTVAGCFESGGYNNGADICRDETNCKSEAQPGIPWHGLRGLAFNLDFDMASGLCQEFHEHVDTEAIDLSSNQVANTRLVDTK